jgi:hypothetical protein
LDTHYCCSAITNEGAVGNYSKFLELTKANNFFENAKNKTNIMRNDQRAIKNNFYQHPEIQSYLKPKKSGTK